MSGRGAARGGQPGSGSGGRTKSGKPRPGTGGQGKRRLAGKGPTPPAELRPGHPAQRRAAARSGPGQSGTGQSGTGQSGIARSGAGWPGDDDQGGGRSTSQPDRGQRENRGERESSRGAGRRAGAARATAGARSAGVSRGTGAAAEVVAGRNAVLESLRARVPAVALHVGPRLDADERISTAITLATEAGLPVVEAGRAELDRLTGGAVHQGLALRLRPYPYAHPDDLLQAGRDGTAEPLIVALDGVTDPRNLGAVARSVAAFGGHGVLVPVRRSAGVTAGAWKASAGALARLPVARAANLARALAGYQQAGLFVVGLDPRGAQDIADLDLADGPLVLVIGSEGSGLSRLVAERCDAVVRIPVTGTESLNAGIAAGIALYQVTRLRAGMPNRWRCGLDFQASQVGRLDV